MIKTDRFNHNPIGLLAPIKGQIQPRLERITEPYSATLGLPIKMYKYTNTRAKGVHKKPLSGLLHVGWHV